MRRRNIFINAEGELEEIDLAEGNWAQAYPEIRELIHFEKLLLAMEKFGTDSISLSRMALLSHMDEK